MNLRILPLDGSEICVTCFVQEIFASLNNQDIKLAEENFLHIRNILLGDSNLNKKAYQLIYLSVRTITGQLLITKLYKLRRDPWR